MTRMTREEALALVKKHIQSKNLLKHCIAVEAIMERLAEHYGEDKEKWALAGLLHDIDYDQTADDPERHSQIGADMLAAEGVEEEIVYAVRVHNERHGLPRKSRLDRALFAADPLSGLIVAAALIHPEKKLSAINPEFIHKRFYEKSFAKGARREQIQTCEEMGLSLIEFITLGYEGMLRYADELGL